MAGDKPAKTPAFNGKEGVAITKPGQKHLESLIKQLAGIEVLVGFPDDGTTHATEDGESSPMTNAALGYIHDNGAPEANIPARPFMLPGIASVQDRISAILGKTAKEAAKEKATPATVERGLIQAGLTAKLGIQNYITAGIDPPLADATLRARARRGHKGAKEELAARKQGLTVPGAVTPIVETGALRNAVNFVIRPKTQRK